MVNEVNCISVEGVKTAQWIDVFRRAHWSSEFNTCDDSPLTMILRIVQYISRNFVSLAGKCLALKERCLAQTGLRD